MRDLRNMMGNEETKQSGFTLLELMIVVAIIGIFSALAIPGIMDIRFRNTLTDSTERVRATVQSARDLAMKTRRAAMVVVRSDKLWVNLLSGPDCTDGVDKAKTGRMANADGVVPLFDSGGLGTSAGIQLVDGAALTLATSSSSTVPTCSTTTTLTASKGFSLCYGGDGELKYHLEEDESESSTDETSTDDEESTDDTSDFNTPCSVDPVTGIAQTTFPDGENVSLTDGIVIGLNRYESGEPVDVLRLVFVPVNGAPYTEIAQ